MMWDVEPGLYLIHARPAEMPPCPHCGAEWPQSNEFTDGLPIEVLGHETGYLCIACRRPVFGEGFVYYRCRRPGHRNERCQIAGHSIPLIWLEPFKDDRVTEAI